ncbi:unnamed protein product [Sphagnum compactum]
MVEKTSILPNNQRETDPPTHDIQSVIQKTLPSQYTSKIGKKVKERDKTLGFLCLGRSLKIHTQTQRPLFTCRIMPKDRPHAHHRDPLSKLCKSSKNSERVHDGQKLDLKVELVDQFCELSDEPVEELSQGSLRLDGGKQFVVPDFFQDCLDSGVDIDCTASLIIGNSSSSAGFLGGDIPRLLIDEAFDAFDEEEDVTKQQLLQRPEKMKKDAEEILKCSLEDLRHVPSLRLDYEDVLNAWSDRGALWTDAKLNPQTVPGEEFFNSDAPPDVDSVRETGEDGSLWTNEPTGPRKARVLRYKEKRRTRLFSKKIRYHVRKLNAERRPRMKGRFVKRMHLSS